MKFFKEILEEHKTIKIEMDSKIQAIKTAIDSNAKNIDPAKQIAIPTQLRNNSIPESITEPEKEILKNIITNLELFYASVNEIIIYYWLGPSENERLSLSVKKKKLGKQMIECYETNNLRLRQQI